ALQRRHVPFDLRDCRENLLSRRGQQVVLRQMSGPRRWGICGAAACTRHDPVRLILTPPVAYCMGCRLIEPSGGFPRPLPCTHVSTTRAKVPGLAEKACIGALDRPTRIPVRYR